MSLRVNLNLTDLINMSKNLTWFVYQACQPEQNFWDRLRAGLKVLDYNNIMCPLLIWAGWQQQSSPSSRRIHPTEYYAAPLLYICKRKCTVAAWKRLKEECWNYSLISLPTSLVPLQVFCWCKILSWYQSANALQPLLTMSEREVSSA